MTKKKTKIIIATILLTGLVLMLACIINIVYIYFDDPWKDGHTEAYLDYVEWTPPVKLKVMYSGLELLGEHKENRLQYYVIDGFLSEKLIAVVKETPLLYGGVDTETYLYYNPETVVDPEELFDLLSAEFFTSADSLHSDVVQISDGEHLRQMFEDLLYAEPMTSREWEKQNGSYTDDNCIASLRLYLDRQKQIQIVLYLYRVSGKYFWRASSSDVAKYVFIPFNEAWLDSIGDEWQDE